MGKALVTAEPLPPSLRESLAANVARVLMAYGTAELGLIGFETEPDQGLRLGSDVLIELCDPVTGQPGPVDEPGEVVVSVLHESYPLLRFGTGDVSRWELVDGELRRVWGARAGRRCREGARDVHPPPSGR